jgi:hypothetical protein
MRLRIIVKHGDSYYIKLAPADMKDNKWKTGDELDIEDLVKINKRGKNGTKNRK